MANDSKAATPDPLFPGYGWPWPFAWPALAPQQLQQPINPGWAFGNVVVNNTNSSAPEVEQAVVSRHSYGRQIGRMMDALQALTDALAKEQPKLAADPRVKALNALCEEVAAIKRSTARDRLQHLQEELAELKRSDPAEWERLAKLLR